MRRVLFNRTKAIRIMVNGRCQGVIRVARPPISKTERRDGLLIFFIAKEARKDDRMLWMIFDAARDVVKNMPYKKYLNWYLMFNAAIPAFQHEWLMGRDAVNSSVVPPRRGGSSVLIDEQTGKPLF